MIKCPNCGRLNSDNAKFCWKCRESLAFIPEVKAPRVRRVSRGIRPTKRKKDLKKIFIVMVVFIFLAIFAVGVFVVMNKKDSTSPEANKTQTPSPTPVVEKKGDKYIELDVAVTEEMIIVKGKTNLEDGTEILIFMSKGGEDIQKKKVEVEEGKFSHNFGPFLFPVYKGDYVITAEQLDNDLKVSSKVYFAGNVPLHEYPENQGYINWRTYTLSQGFEEAKKEGKLILLFFFGSSPQIVIDQLLQEPDDYMLKEVFGKNKEVRGIVNAYYIPIKIDGAANRDLALRYDVRVYPSIIILDVNGNVVGSLKGLPMKGDTVRIDLIIRKLLEFAGVGR